LCGTTEGPTRSVLIAGLGGGGGGGAEAFWAGGGGGGGGGVEAESMCTVWLADQAAVVANHCSGQPAKIRSKI